MKAENFSTSASRGIDPLAIEQVSSVQAQVVGKLYATLPMAFELAGRVLNFQWQHVKNWTRKNAPLWPAVGVSLAGRQYEVHIERGDLISHAIGLDLFTLKPVARHALLAEAAKKAVELIEQTARGMLAFHEAEPMKNSRGFSAYAGFVLYDKASGWRCEGIVRSSDDEGFTQLAALCVNWPRDEPQVDEQTRVPLTVEIGQSQLSVCEIDGIVPGDLLLIHVAGSQQKALPVRLTPGAMPGFTYTGFLHEDKITIMDAGHNGHNEVAGPNKGWEGAVVESMDDLAVNLSFELGEQSLTLRELKQLKPGYVLTLQQSASQVVVRIRDSRGWLGHGQLLCVGDTVGVRVIQFLRHAG